MVILHHALLRCGAVFQYYVQYTIGHAVPLFFLVTILLHYNKFSRSSSSSVNVTRIFKTVLLPFLCVQCLLIPIYVFQGNDISNCLIKCGVGMGSYYVSVFLQIVFLSKYMFRLLQHNFYFATLLIFFVFLVPELVFVNVGLPHDVYRLLCTRYLFLFVIAYIIFDHDLFRKFRFLLIVLAVLGLVLQAGTIQLGYEYFLYPTFGFPTHKVYRDFITLWLFLGLWKCYDFFPSRVIVFLGKHSFILYLLQMIYFFLF